ncbi:MAG: hypothetical protein JWM95_2578 [Gemmatimonadetes bacterium]|nr:hypothetical protein [Gemmatimonadota bacterium]
MWFGQPARLNDPFDCAVPWKLKPITTEDCLRLLADRSDPEWVRLQSEASLVDAHGFPTQTLMSAIENSGQKAFTQLAETYYGARGVTYFSESPDSTLLWSHYGGGHRGICLEFDTSSAWLSRLHPITYGDSLPALTTSEIDLVCHTLVGTPVQIYQARRSSSSFALEMHPVTYTPFRYSRADVV